MNRETELILKYKSKPGLKGKIIAMCIDCTYDSKEKGTWRQQIENCCCPGCPLYEVRPKSTAQGS